MIFTVLAFSASANAAFLGRLPATPGGTDYQAYYDTQLGITWAQDSDILGSGGYYDLNYALDSLSINGADSWRLPKMDVDGDGVIVDCAIVTQEECRDNQYGHLFWYGAGTTLSNGINDLNPGPFSVNASDPYFSSTTIYVGGVDNYVWNLDFESGLQGQFSDSYSIGLGWAILNGDVSSVPVPAAVWLFGSGLLGLIGITRKKKV